MPENLIEMVKEKFTFFFKMNLWPNLAFFFNILRPHFQNSFVPIPSYVFFAKLKDGTQNAIENRTPV